MLYRLAAELGIWDVQRLEWEMSLPQYREWMEFMEIRAEQDSSEDVSQRASANRRRAARGSYP